MKKKLLVASLFGLVISVAAIAVGVNLATQKGKQAVTPKAAPATSLFFNPASTTKYLTQSFPVTVKVNTGTNAIVSADIVLNFDPRVLEVTGVSPGNFLTGVADVQKNWDNQNGKIVYSFYTSAVNAKQGDGNLVEINFKAKGVGVSQLTFDSQTAIGALGEYQNVLTVTTPGSYTVQVDTLPPAPILDLKITGTSTDNISLSWTAPVDSGILGKAFSYELRYSANPIIDEASWQAATLFYNLPSPASPGSLEAVTISGLTAGTTYYFAIKSKDENNNISSLSNVASGATEPKPSLSFKIKFQGITTQKPERKMRVILKQADEVKYTFNDVSTISDSSGVYSGTVSDINIGTYDVFIKGPTHLQEKFVSVNLNPGQNQKDWSSTLIKAGDLDGTNFINAVDIGMVIQDYFPNNPPNSRADFNLDGTVNSVDIGFVIENYFKSGAI